MSVLNYLQKIGRALMLPVATLPAAAILMGIGYWIDPNGWGGGSPLAAFLIKAGGAIIENMSWLFAVGIAYGMSKDKNGAAALAGLVGFFVVKSLCNPEAVSMILSIPLQVPGADGPHKSSPVHFLGTHCYDQIRWYMGCEVEEVYAVGTKTLLKSKGIDTWDTVQAFLKFENGCYWTVENSWIFPSGFPKANDGRTQILTENALLKADSQNRGVEFYNDSKLRTPNSYFIIDNNGRPFGFGIEPINDFIYCLLNDQPFIADANDGLEAEKIADAVHQSLEIGQAVKITKG